MDLGACLYMAPMTQAPVNRGRASAPDLPRAALAPQTRFYCAAWWLTTALALIAG